MYVCAEATGKHVWPAQYAEVRSKLAECLQPQCMSSIELQQLRALDPFSYHVSSYMIVDARVWVLCCCLLLQVPGCGANSLSGSALIIPSL
jgi:hypothetical protein